MCSNRTLDPSSKDSTLSSEPEVTTSEQHRATLTIGAKIDDKYTVMGLLGSGGASHVYACRTQSGEDVAVKVLRKSVEQSSTLAARFDREARAAARVASRRVVDVLGHGVLESGERYLVLERLRGETLQRRLHRERRLAVDEVVTFALAILHAVADVHAADMCHRDLKPSNIFVEDGTGRIKLLDFGISRAVDDLRVTGSGVVLGTKHYIAPEHVIGNGSVDLRADLFSVGVIMYRALVGHVPFPFHTAAQVMVKSVRKGCPRIQRVMPELDDDLACIVDRTLSRRPEDRFQSARALIAVLRMFQARATSDEDFEELKTNHDVLRRRAPRTSNRRADAMRGTTIVMRTQPCPVAPVPDTAQSAVSGIDESPWASVQAAPDPRRRRGFGWAIVIAAAAFAVTAGLGAAARVRQPVDGTRAHAIARLPQRILNDASVRQRPEVSKRETLVAESFAARPAASARVRIVQPPAH